MFETMPSCRTLVLTLAALALPLGPAAALPSAAECVGTRYIGVVPSSSLCTGTTAGWQRTRLFPDHTQVELARYCVFTWTGSGPPATAQLPIYPFNDSPRLDCAAVTGHASLFETTEQAALEASFRAQVETLSALPTSIGPWASTKVVVVDSSITSGFPDPSPGLIDHGRTVGLLVRELACGSGAPLTCRARVSNSLALPLIRVGSAIEARPATGGRFGTFGQAAYAIIAGFDAAALAPPAAPTIINLSIGWDPTLGGAYTGSNHQDLEPPVRAVHSALTYVACKNGLAIAASGNASNGVDELGGPSYPGGWEVKSSPGAARCASLGGLVAGPAVVTSHRPLLYAVGGVDGRDRPLRNRRPSSVPSLVAPASHATISQAGVDPTRVFTGSSMAAAVTSAAAATMWSYLPNWSRHDVMEKLRSSAIDLGWTPAVQAAWCAGGGWCPTSVRRVSFCRAVAEACRDNAVCSPSVVSCPVPTVPRDARPAGLAYATPNALQIVQPPFGPARVPPADSPCTTPIFTSSPIAPLQCPADTYPNNYARPYTGPQPGTGLCPTCVLRLDGSLLLDLDPDVGGVISQPTLVPTFHDGTKKTFPLDIPPAELVAGALIVVKNGPANAQEVSSATIEFVVTVNGDVSSHSDPLLIEK